MLQKSIFQYPHGVGGKLPTNTLHPIFFGTVSFPIVGPCPSHALLAASFSNLTLFFLDNGTKFQKGGPGASGRVLPPVTGRSRVRVAVSSHCTGEGKACHWHPSPDPAQSGSSLHWVRPYSSLNATTKYLCSILHDTKALHCCGFFKSICFFARFGWCGLSEASL